MSRSLISSINGDLDVIQDLKRETIIRGKRSEMSDDEPDDENKKTIIRGKREDGEANHEETHSTITTNPSSGESEKASTT